MNGKTIYSWITILSDLYGDNAINKAIKYMKWNDVDRVKNSMNISSREAQRFVIEVANTNNIDINEVWELLGEGVSQNYIDKNKGSINQKNLYQFLNSLNYTKGEMGQDFKYIYIPKIIVKPLSEREAYIIYNSAKEMYYYFLGFLKAWASYFNENLDYRKVKTQDNSLIIKIVFQYNIVTNFNYNVSKILSFGFIRYFPVKVMIPTLLITFIMGLMLTNFQKAFIMSIVSGVVTLITTIVLIEPRERILEEIGRITEGEDIPTIISTNDFFEDIYNELKLIKTISPDSLIKINEEQKLLANSVKSYLYDTKREIEKSNNSLRDVLDYVIQGKRQADRLFYKIDDSNIELEDIFKRERENETKINIIIRKVMDSYSNLQDITLRISKASEYYMKIKDVVTELKEKASGMTTVISTVSNIAEQTNLLALNASIEASRAGEQGKGFSVVALSIRKLAEQSKKAVLNINEDLKSFDIIIEDLINRVDCQYKVLEHECIQIKDVSLVNKDSIEFANNVIKECEVNTKLLKNQSDYVGKLSSSVDKIRHSSISINEELKAIVEKQNENIEEVNNIINNLGGVLH